MLRNIRTEYYDHKGNVIRTNNAIHPNKATLHAVSHLQDSGGDYNKAFCAVVFDENMGELHSVIVHNTVGHISIELVRDPKKPTCLVMES